jgi:hypothetical protein
MKKFLAILGGTFAAMLAPIVFIVGIGKCVSSFVTSERVFYWAAYNLILGGACFAVIGWNVIFMGKGVAWSSPTLEESEYSAPVRNK